MAPDQQLPQRSGGLPSQRQPLAAGLHFIPRALSPLQNALVRLLRRYFERAPNWVLLTTTGRTTGLPREVLLPCERWQDGMYVISTYGAQSNWMRNIARNQAVQVISGGWVLDARAEIIDDLAAKQSIVSKYPFFVPLPLAPLNLLHRTILRPLTVGFLRWWVNNRPIVVIRPRTNG